MEMHRASFLLVLCSILLIDCKEASTASDSSQGTDTQDPAGDGTGSSAPSGQSGGQTSTGTTPSIDHTVAEHHGSGTRAGLFLEPTFTKAAIATMHRDASFAGTFTGSVHAQPVYTPNGPNGHGALYVATMSNDLLAFDETNGSLLFSKSFGQSVTQLNADCTRGNYPLGIFGTPYLDMQRRLIYFDTAIGTNESDGSHYLGKHLIHALSIDTGEERAGWPIDVTGVSANGQTFDPTVQSQRGALTLLGDMLYVPYGSMADCGAYHGWLMAIPVDDPAHLSAWATSGRGGGMWSNGGVSSDGESIFVATGNGTESSSEWAGQNAIVRFGPGTLAQPADLFAPEVWPELDSADLDLGGTNATILDIPGADPSRLVMALGKDGWAYLLDRDRLGGTTEGDSAVVAEQQIVSIAFASSAAVFNAGGDAYVVADAQAGGSGVACPPGQSGDLVAIRVKRGIPPTLETAWCMPNLGHGVPIVTATSAGTEPIVWATGATGSGLLRGYDGLTGELVWSGGQTADAMDPARLHRFSTLIAIGGRLVVAEDNQLVLFKP